MACHSKGGFVMAERAGDEGYWDDKKQVGNNTKESVLTTRDCRTTS